MDLTLDECIRVNASLLKAVKSTDVGALKDILATLKASDVKNKLKHLAESKLGQTVSKLCKYEQSGDVKAAATDVKRMWAARAAAAKEEGKKAQDVVAKPEPMAVVKEEVKSESTSAAKPGVHASEAAAVKAEGGGDGAGAGSNAAPASVGAATAASSSTAAAGSSTDETAVKLVKQESISQVTWRPAQLTHDQTRDMVRQRLQEAFDKGKTENERFLHEQVTDTAAMAEEAEERMFSVFGGVTKEYKARYRSLVFNLKDPKNPHFIKAIICGQIHTDELAVMEVREMANEEMKKQRQEQAEHAKMALMDDRTYKNYAGKKTEDGILKCPRCKSMKTEYIEVQTRSADEPTTKKCTCNSCDYRWKFC